MAWIIPAPTPCATLSPISCAILWLRPQSAPARVKMTKPATYTHLYPTMSPRRPKVSRSAPVARRKATTTHSTSEMPTPKSFAMAGKEMLTMLALRVDMKVPKETTESTTHLPTPGSVPRPEDWSSVVVPGGCLLISESSPVTYLVEL